MSKREAYFFRHGTAGHDVGDHSPEAAQHSDVTTLPLLRSCLP
jgi:hypothetical protein